MKSSSRPPRRPSKLSDSIHQRLDSYALAASAAGVSLLALAEPAGAKIVYKPTHRVIGDGSIYRLDFTGRGTTDLTVLNKRQYQNTTYGNNASTWQSLYANLSGSGQVVYRKDLGGSDSAVAIKAGMRIGSKDAFAGRHQNMAFGYSSFYGSWVNVKSRYLGVKFRIKGRYHYGWARLSVQVQRPLIITATLTGYAYETIPNKPIIAGKTHGPDVIVKHATLGALALGRK